MADRDKILRYFKASGDEELAARLVDLAEAARKTARYKVSEFLDPHGRNVADIVAANFEGIRLESDGGFANAERSGLRLWQRILRYTGFWTGLLSRFLG